MTPYPSGSQVSVTFDLLYADGTTIPALSASYTLLDKDDGVLMVETPVSGFVANAPTAIVVIPGSQNQLAAGVRSDVRRILLKLTTSDGEIVEADNVYLIQSSSALLPMVDSYQTTQQAELTALSIPDIEAFRAASNLEKSQALAEAFNRIGKLRFNVNGVNIPSRDQITVDNYDYSLLNNGSPSDTIKSIPSLNSMTLTQFRALPAMFTDAVLRAQVVEADTILGGDPISKKRAEGLMADSVGQSSIMFRPGKPLALGVSRRALEQLSGWLSFNMRVGRA